MTVTRDVVAGFADAQPVDPEAIRRVKSRVAAMMTERAQLRGDVPSEYWSGFCRYFRYLPGLRDEDFAGIRVHTYHLTGDNYQYYYFADDQRKRLLRQRWESLVGGLPPELILSEPSDGYGFVFDGHVVNLDILDYQRVVTNLNLSGVLEPLIHRERRLVLEIGSGYGGFAHQLSTLFAATSEGRTTIVLIDLPEVLLFSAAYLTIHHSEIGIYLYDRNDVEQMLQPETVEQLQFVLLPNYRIDLLSKFEFDLAVNMRSLQEMRADQIARYLDIVAETCTGHFYSFNQDFNPKNNELGGERGVLSDFIRSRFEVVEILPPPPRPLDKVQIEARRLLRKAALRMRVVDEVEDHIPPPHREYVCRTIDKG